MNDKFILFLWNNNYCCMFRANKEIFHFLVRYIYLFWNLGWVTIFFVLFLIIKQCFFNWAAWVCSSSQQRVESSRSHPVFLSLIRYQPGAGSLIGQVIPPLCSVSKQSPIGLWFIVLLLLLLLLPLFMLLFLLVLCSHFRRRLAPMVRNGAFSHKIDHITSF